MAFFRPRIIFLGLLALILILLISFPHIELFIEKHSLNSPPPYKRLTDVKGVSVQPASIEGKIKYPQDYTIVLLGDSMTEKLGNADELRGYLNEYYPDKTFEVLNYGYGSTNILSLMDRITKHTFHTRDFRPINEILYNLIIIESMGYNPLSELPLDQGLQKQNQTLDEITTELKKGHPDAQIVFLATIAPDRKTYAKTTVDVSDEERKKWVEERNRYIENHIQYAKDHSIPVIDLYHASMDANDNGKYIYIDQTDYIHPSPTGVLYISKGIADFIAKNKLVESNH